MNTNETPIRRSPVFKCPKCGIEGYFGTFTFHEKMREHPMSVFYQSDYKDNDRIGICNASQYVQGNKCDYRWVRGPDNDKGHFVEPSTPLPKLG